MVIVSHPTGNANVRAVLAALQQHQQLGAFFTTLGVHREDWWLHLLPKNAQRQALRRAYDIPRRSLHRYPGRELMRHAANRFGWNGLTCPERGWASVDAVYRSLDKHVAGKLTHWQQEGATHVYAYEDGARDTFVAAERLGMHRVYELPIAYWETSAHLLREEADRWPQWKPTLIGPRDNSAKFERKKRELEEAETVITPSRFVYDSLPDWARHHKKCHVVPFGSPSQALSRIERDEHRESHRSLRVLFVGSLTQRKGLADVFAAMKLLHRRDVELVVMGSLVQPLEFYRREYADFRYETPRPHQEVLLLMQSCDVLVLPSIVEGRALVQQEALASGLPLLVTPNAGGEDLIDEGETGFLLPIRSPQYLAEKIDWFAEHRDILPDLRRKAREKAARYTWERYGTTVSEIIAATR